MHAGTWIETMAIYCLYACALRMSTKGEEGGGGSYEMHNQNRQGRIVIILNKWQRMS
jgi:hypothetical protein